MGEFWSLSWFSVALFDAVFLEGSFDYHGLGLFSLRHASPDFSQQVRVRESSLCCLEGDNPKLRWWFEQVDSCFPVVKWLSHRGNISVPSLQGTELHQQFVCQGP